MCAPAVNCGNSLPGVAKFEQMDAIGNFVIARDAQRHRRWRRLTVIVYPERAA